MRRRFKKDKIEGVFAGATQNSIKPTVIYALFKLKEVQAARGTKFDSAHPRLSMTAFY